MIKQSKLNSLELLFSSKRKVEQSDWQKRFNELVIRPEGTREFDSFIEAQSKRYEEGHSPEDAAKSLNKTINILYYQRHPATHMMMLAAII